jgi:NAD(P)-dependent dehydrogenase (short-subunit alcohol dehydrogenase family)
VSWLRPLATAVDLLLEATVVGSFSRIGYGTRRAIWGWSAPPGRPLTGKVAVVTGATSGLGRALATRLAEVGVTVVVVGRDPDRISATRAAIISKTGNESVAVARCDLAKLSDVRAVADRLQHTHHRIDLLVHNAGALSRRHERTGDGIELTVQTHVVAPFLLTHELTDRLRSTPGAQVLTVSSGGMYTQPLRSLDIGAEDYVGTRAYALAKRAQVVLNEQWAARHPEVASFHAMHPGWVDTPGLADSLPGFHRRMGPLLRSPEQGIDTLLWLAGVAPPAASGRFWLDRRARWTSKVPWTRTAPGDAAALWSWVATHAGVGPAGRLAPAAPAARI